MKNLAILTIAFVLFSCSKNIDETKPDSQIKPIAPTNFNPFVAADQESDIIISASSINGSTSKVEISGQFSDDGISLLPVGSFTVDGANIPYVNDRYYGFYPTDTSNFVNELNLFGNTINVNVTGAYFGSINENIYSPELIKLSLSQPFSAINKNQSLTLTWTPDPNNSYDNVYFILIPRPLNPNTSLPVLQEIIPDNGSYTIQSSIFSGYSENGSAPNSDAFDIFIIRGNEMIIDHGNEKETLISFYNFDSYRCFMQ